MTLVRVNRVKEAEGNGKEYEKMGFMNAEFVRHQDLGVQSLISVRTGVFMW